MENLLADYYFLKSFYCMGYTPLDVNISYSMSLF